MDKLLESIDLILQCTTSQRNNPGAVLLLGAPGVGKGTQADLQARLWDIPKISTGEILRTNVASRTALGLQADRIMKSGGLVPDQIVTEMVTNRLEFSDTVTGFILDGFPRNIRQAQWLDQYLCTHRKGEIPAIVYMCMDYGQILQRVAYRRVCPLCKTVYNTLFMPPKQIGRCDKDNHELEQRSDDTVEVLEERLRVFRRETEPLVQYYRDHSNVIEIDAGQSSSLVTKDIVSGLTEFRSALGNGSLNK